VQTNESSVVGVNFWFNGWGNKQIHGNDSKVAESLLAHYELPCMDSGVVGEGGAFETDGKGTLLVTESSVVNDNRNKGVSKDELEKRLKASMGITKVIWFPGVKGKDITDAHVDCLARFASEGVVVLNRPYKGANDSTDVWTKSSDEAKAILEKSTDASGKPFKIVELHEPHPDKISYTGKNSDTFLSSYVNYLVTNGGVVMPKFGDAEADLEAKTILEGLYPGREVVAVEINTLASGGGGIHCSTHDLPI